MTNLAKLVDKSVTLDLPLEAIIVDLSKNFREDYDTKDLEKSIKKDGLLQSVVVTRDENGHFELVAGFRRFLSAQNLGLTTISARVVEGEAAVSESYWLTATENLQRQDFSPYEQAKMLQKIRDTSGLSAQKISTRLGRVRGYSASHINSLIRALENLDPDVLEEWSAGNPACTIANIFAWSSLSHEDQQAALAEAMGGPSRERPETGSSKDVEKVRRQVSPKALNLVRVLIEENDEGGPIHHAVSVVLDYCDGLKSIDDVEAVLSK